MESSLLFILERGLGIVLQAMQEKKALHLACIGRQVLYCLSHQGIFPTQELNLHLLQFLHCRHFLYC